MQMMCQEEKTNMMNMMYGFGLWWFLGMGMMVLFWIAIILLVVWVVRSLFPHDRLSEHDQALETLRQRYAKVRSVRLSTNRRTPCWKRSR
jgi:uncharacterized membrane protein